MTDIAMTIANIIDKNSGIDKYGILTILTKEHDYNYMHDKKFDSYVSEAMQHFDIRQDSGKYYFGRIYNIQVRLENGLKPVNCYHCPFKVRVDQLDDYTVSRDKDKEDYKDCVCGLNIKIRFSPNMSNLPKDCPRVKAYEKMKEGE